MENASCVGICELKQPPKIKKIHRLNVLFEQFNEAEWSFISGSLLRRYLKPPLFEQIKRKRTKWGHYLLDCVKSGFRHDDSKIGIFACDDSAYETFYEIFDRIINFYHGGFGSLCKHPPTDWGHLNSIIDLDPEKKYIISTRIRARRCLHAFPFASTFTEERLIDMEKKVAVVLLGLKGEIKGQYYPLRYLNHEIVDRLIGDNMYFGKSDKFVYGAGGYAYWPIGRGVYHTEDKKLLIWLNPDDHFKIVSMQIGGDLGAVYRRLVCAVKAIETKLKYAHSERLGYLNFSPAHIGTGLKISVYIKLPKLKHRPLKLHWFADRRNLTIRNSPYDCYGYIYEITNNQVLGITEYELVKHMQDSITDIIKAEEAVKLRKKKPKRKPPPIHHCEQSFLLHPKLYMPTIINCVCCNKVH